MISTQDFLLNQDPPLLRIPPEEGRAKSPGDVPIDSEDLEELKRLQKGLKKKRTLKNQHGAFTRWDVFPWPSAGRLFPTKTGMATNHKGVRGVQKAIGKLAPNFDKLRPDNSFSRIRSHSGRATRITMLMGEGMPMFLSMRYARHAPGSYETHLGYARLTVKDIHKHLEEYRTKVMVELSQHRPAKPKELLDECTLSELITWYKDGLISTAHFEAAKQKAFSNL